MGTQEGKKTDAMTNRKVGVYIHWELITWWHTARKRGEVHQSATGKNNEGKKIESKTGYRRLTFQVEE